MNHCSFHHYHDSMCAACVKARNTKSTPNPFLHRSANVTNHPTVSRVTPLDDHDSFSGFGSDDPFPSIDIFSNQNDNTPDNSNDTSYDSPTCDDGASGGGGDTSDY